MPKRAIPAEALELLRQPNPCVIATLKRDGSPHTVPTWYLWDDDHVVVSMDASRKRLEYIRHDPRVSLSIIDRETWYRHVSLGGVAYELVDDHGLRDIDRLSEHYDGERYAVRDRPRVTARIRVVGWHFWGAEQY